MSTEIMNMNVFLKTHIKFLEGLSVMLKDFMSQKDEYILQDRYVAEFIEKFEAHNLHGYNNGGYAYAASGQILNPEPEEESQDPLS